MQLDERCLAIFSVSAEDGICAAWRGVGPDDDGSRVFWFMKPRPDVAISPLIQKLSLLWMGAGFLALLEVLPGAAMFVLHASDAYESPTVSTRCKRQRMWSSTDLLSWEIVTFS